MNQNNQTPSTTVYQQPAYEDEISLIDICLTIKRNSKLFFAVIIISFLISLIITYYKQQLQIEATNAISKRPDTEHVLIIEMGRIYGEGARQDYIDQPGNLLAKIKTIYIPKLNQTSITAEHIKSSDLIIIKAVQTSDKVNYDRVLLTLAGYILKDHKSAINLQNRNSIKPTRIIQQPTKRAVKSNTSITSKMKYIIPILGLILGFFIGLFAVYFNEFIKKVKKAENKIKMS